MRLALAIWVAGVVHFAGFAVIYALSADEAAGEVLLIAGAAFAGLVAGWAWVWYRNHRDELPSDRADADMSEGAGPVGVFPTASLRPLALGVGMSGVALGVVVGLWMTLVGLAIVLSQVALLIRDVDS
jgi:hypothetical protein